MTCCTSCAGSSWRGHEPTKGKEASAVYEIYMPQQTKT